MLIYLNIKQLCFVIEFVCHKTNSHTKKFSVDIFPCLLQASLTGKFLLIMFLMI